MQHLDLCGLKCPIPVLETKKFLANLTTGEVVTVVSDDPDSYLDLQNFCAKTGNNLISQNQLGNLITTIIQRR